MASDALPKIVHVKWHDASHPQGEWQPVVGLKRRSMLAQSVGFLVLDAPDQIIVAGTVDRLGSKHSHFTGEICIPRVCVVSIKVLDEPKKKRKPKTE